jgi:hypothetical protein
LMKKKLPGARMDGVRPAIFFEQRQAGPERTIRFYARAN